MLTISKCAYLSVPLLMLCLVQITEGTHRFKVAKTEEKMSEQPLSLESLFRVRRTSSDEVNLENCEPQEFDLVHTIMDRICMLCHEIRSHYEPNTRLECSKNCYRTTTFQSCLKIFSARRPVQQVEPTAPVPLYTEDEQTLDDLKERRRRL
ncbi:unnamed protein product [Caenorhabditis brenneri]